MIEKYNFGANKTMTIGKSSKKNKAPRSPPFLDRSSGFYGRLDETDVELRAEEKITEKQPASKPGAGEGNRRVSSTGSSLPEEQDHGVPDFNEGMLEDDGITLLKRKPSRLSRRWSRLSSKKAKSEKPSQDIQNQSSHTKSEAAPSVNRNVLLETNSEVSSGSRAPESMIVHFSVKEDGDDQILITEQKEKQLEIDDMKRECELEKEDIENMKVMKRNSLRNYRKVLDTALRRGWETFVTNLNSVTLTPVSSSSSSPSKSEMNRKATLADFR